MTGTFDEMRPKLEKQYENAVYAQEGAWDEAQLRAALAARRRELQKPDGSWTNDNNRFWEADPVLCTSFAMIVLGLCR